MKNRPVLFRVLPSSLVDTETSMLQTVIQTGTGKAADIGIWAAGKTGTTENYGDAWFVGFTHRLTVAVWVGYPNNIKSMKTDFNGGPVLGGTFPALIWHDFMNSAESIYAGYASNQAGASGSNSNSGSSSATSTGPTTSSGSNSGSSSGSSTPLARVPAPAEARAAAPARRPRRRRPPAVRAPPQPNARGTPAIRRRLAAVAAAARSPPSGGGGAAAPSRLIRRRRLATRRGPACDGRSRDGSSSAPG